MSTKEQLAYERADKEVARCYFEEYYPDDATRRTVLTLLADTIGKAHMKATNQWRWSLTLRPSDTPPELDVLARLNLSKAHRKARPLLGLDLCRERRKGCGIARFIVPHRIGVETEKAITDIDGEVKVCTLGRDYMPDPHWVYIPATHITTHYPLVEASHRSMIYGYPYAVEALPESNTKEAHSPGPLAYLREELPDRIIPDPSDIAPDRGGSECTQGRLPILPPDEDDGPPGQGGQGYVDDAKRRQALELYAMECARAYYSPTHEIQDVSQQKRGYDLLCLPRPENVSGRELHVEVKGTCSSGTEVILTAGEVEHARTHRAHSVLFVVAKIKLDPTHDGYKPSGGVQVGPFKPWIIEEGSLTPTEYRYQVPPTSFR